MKTIEQHEAENIRRREHGPTLCGIECPMCGEELSADPTTRLMSLPPRKVVHCFNCNWTGSVTA